MPSISDAAGRHVVIDKRDGEYIAFPDVIRTDDGRLVVAYNEADKHVQPSRRTLLLKTSDDNGKTWSDITRMDSRHSHCPRLTRLDNGELLLSDSAQVFFRSTDGLNWITQPAPGLAHDMIDKVVDLGDDVFITTGHTHRGTFQHPAIGQAPSEQMVYRSKDRGNNWQAHSVLAAHRNLVLCEASMLHLPDGRIAALMRENSFVYEPMYIVFSEDGGGSWTDPVPTPLIGHRPTMGITPDERLLVTYRNVAPTPGTSAWLGTLDELTSGFQVQGSAPTPSNPTLTPDGLRIVKDDGSNSAVRYALRPMTDPRTATASLEAEVKVDQADENGCAIRFGGLWWRLFPDRIEPCMDDAQPVSLAPGFNTLYFDYVPGRTTLMVNGETRVSAAVTADLAETRPIMLGAVHPSEKNNVDCTWKRIGLDIDEPAWQRNYSWRWNADNGLPDQWARNAILELKNARHAAAPDFGYSGWTTLEDGSFFCVFHHADDDDAYDPLHTSHIRGVRFSPEDFK